MFKSSVGHSEDIDSLDAVHDVINQVRANLGGLSPSAGLLFCSISFDHSIILSCINDAFPAIELIGCSSFGENSSIGGFSEESVTLIVFASDTIKMKAGLGKGVSADGEKAANMAVRSAIEALGESPKLAIALPESYMTNGARFVQSLSAAFDNDTTIVGGFSADPLLLKDTRQFYKNEVLTDCVPVLVFGGPILFSIGRESGWAPLGHEATITRSEGNIVREIDMKPATEYFGKYLGPSQGGVTEYGDYPLMVRENDEVDFCLRSAMSADGKTGGIVFLSEIPIGAKVKVCEASRDMVVEGTRQSVLAALNSYPGENPAAALLFSCASRRNVLGTRTKEEVEAVKGSTSSNVPICGFYTYGEIAPARVGGRTLYNNDTFITLFVGDK